MGRIYKPRYSMTLADGLRVTRTVKWWHVEYTDADGRTRRRKAAPSQVLARQILAQVETDVAKERAGLPSKDAARISTADLLDRYLRSQESRVCRGHLENLQYRIGSIVAFARAQTVRDLTPEKVDAFLASLVDRSPPVAMRTVNAHLQSVKGMLNWAVSMRILPFNPLACMKPRPLGGRFMVRRSLSTEELDRLLEAAKRGPLHREGRKRWGSPVPPEVREAALRKGERNYLVYRMLAFTGLRLNELTTLHWGDLDLDQGRLLVRAPNAKNRREAVVDLPADLVGEIQAWRAANGDPALSMPVVHVSQSMLRTFFFDLKLAGIPRVDDAGRKVDLHSLRHTYGTMLVRSGADIKTVQTLMRHSTPSMTLGIYVHYDSAKLKQAVASLCRAPTQTVLVPQAISQGA